MGGLTTANVPYTFEGEPLSSHGWFLERDAIPAPTDIPVPTPWVWVCAQVRANRIHGYSHDDNCNEVTIIMVTSLLLLLSCHRARVT